METASQADNSSTEEATQAWYQAYYAARGADRNDLLGNPEVLFQSLAFEVANVRALRRLKLNRKEAAVLDVGCGSGAGLLNFLKLGFSRSNLAGIDINSERIDEARRTLPSVDFRCESADHMSFDSESFDIVFESTMFVQLTDERLAAAIAREMLRVTKQGGYIVIVDWRYAQPGSREYRAVSPGRIANLFEIRGGGGRVTGGGAGRTAGP